MTTTTRAETVPQGADGAFTHRQILTVISGLMLGMFLAALDQTVVSTAIRTIADDLDGYSLQAWATTAFLITSTISTPLYGKLSDTYGRKPFYLAAIGIFVVGSALCATADSMYQLAIWRALQGLGAGGLMSLAFAILGDMVSPRERSKYQAYFMAVFASSSVIGPVVGGVLAGADSIAGITGWRWIFLVNVPLGIAALVVVTRVLNLQHTPRPQRLDWPGALTLVMFLVPVLVVAEQGRLWGWGSERSLVAYAVGIVGLVLFIAVEARFRDAALLPLRMFRNRTFTVGVLSSVVVGTAMFGGLLLVPQFLQVVKGSSPTEAGFQMLPLVVGIMSASAICGVVIGRTGKYRKFPIIGSVLLTAALFGLSRITADTSYPVLVPLLLAMGMGLGFNFQPVVLAAQNAADPRDMGVATSSVTFFRQMGGTLGTAGFLSILFSLLGGRVSSSYADAAASDTAFQAASAANPDQLAALQSATSGALDDTSFLTQLDPAIAHPFYVGFTDSLTTIFLIAACLMLVGIVISLFLPEVPLRTQSGAQARAEAVAREAAAAEGSPTDRTDGTDGAEAPCSAQEAAMAGAPTSTAPPVPTTGTAGTGGSATTTAAAHRDDAPRA